MGHAGGARTTGAEGERDIAQDIAGASRGRGREAGHNSRIMKLKSMYQYPVIFIVVSILGFGFALAAFRRVRVRSSDSGSRHLCLLRCTSFRLAV